jgi:hypothetical protein
MKSASLLLGVFGTAAGLNLSVMGLGAQQPESAEVTTASFVQNEPEFRQVVVDVPLPENATVAALPTPTATPSVAPAIAASPSPIAAAAPTSPAATTPPTAPAAAPSSTAPATAPPSTAPATSTPSTAAPTTSTAPPTTAGSTTEYLTYTFDGVAEIVVAYHDGESLEFWSATPEPGWAYMVEKDRADEVELKFRRVSGGEGEAKFKLIRENGQLEVKTED